MSGRGNANSGTLTGRLGSDGWLRGTFVNKEATPQLRGSFELTLEGRTFEGTWRHDIDPPGTNRLWSATCIADACLNNG